MAEVSKLWKDLPPVRAHPAPCCLQMWSLGILASAPFHCEFSAQDCRKLCVRLLYCIIN